MKEGLRVLLTKKRPFFATDGLSIENKSRAMTE